MGDSADQLDHGLLYSTVIVFAVISWLIYRFVLVQQPTPVSGAAPVAPARAATTREGAPGPTTAPTNLSQTQDEDYFSYGEPRHPPHLVPPEGWSEKKTRASGFLNQGVVPFRSTLASGYETRLQNDMNKKSNTKSDISGEKLESASADLVAVNRRERARIFARLFSTQVMCRNSPPASKTSDAKMQPPPNRGANIVVTIHHADISCEKLQKALFLLGTYYNLFVVVDGSDSSLTDEMKEDTFIKKIRSELLQNDENASEPGMVNMYKLNSQILPPHRIVFSTTSAGRVAFVRQLHGAELVVDGNEKVATELERFGFRVIVYPNAGSDGGSTSALGRVLIP